MITALRGAVWTLGAYAAANALVSAIVAAVAGTLVARAADLAPAARLRLFATARALPSVLAASAAVVAFREFLLEPSHDPEPMRLAAVVLAAGALALFLAVVGRTLQGLYEVAALSREWLRDATRLPRSDAPIPVYRIKGAARPMTLVGGVNPRLFVSESFLAVVTEAELAAALDHEWAHLRSWDNAKRLGFRMLPDMLFMLPSGLRLERAWAAAAEHAADQAVARTMAARLDLASALLKAVRLPQPAGHLVLASPLVGEGIVARIERLLEPRPDRPLSTRQRIVCGVFAVLLAGMIAGSLVMPLQGLHAATEGYFEDVMP